MSEGVTTSAKELMVEAGSQLFSCTGETYLTVNFTYLGQLHAFG